MVIQRIKENYHFTDWDTNLLMKLAPIMEAQRAGLEFGVDIINGAEIQTSLPRGLHVIGLFLKKAIS